MRVWFDEGLGPDQSIGDAVNNQRKEGIFVAAAEIPANMRTALAAEADLPLIAFKPAMLLVGVSGVEAAAGLAKTENQKLDTVWVGHPVAMLTIHFNAELLCGDRPTAGATVNG